MLCYLPMGRHGNAHFQAAATIALALRNGVEFSMPTQTSSQVWSPLILQHLVNSKYQQGQANIVIEENQFHYVPIEYKKEWDNQQVLLKGYYQSEKHFIDFKDEVLKLFNYPWTLNEGVVSIHLRRTDFLELKNKHPEVKDDWYFEAMALFPNKKFLIFSDDIPYCKQAFAHRNDCYFSEGNSIQEDLIAMSCCEHHINSASTFSWWASYLGQNENKKIITPSAWFTPDWDGADVKDLIPESWIKL